MKIRKPALATVLGATALAVALTSTGGVAEAAKMINGKFIKANTVTTKQIKNGTITPADLSAAAKVAGGQGPQGVPGPAGPAGAAGQDGEDGTSIAAASIAADGTRLMAKVNGSNVLCSGICFTPFYRIRVTHPGTGSYCVYVEKNTGTIVDPNYTTYASADDSAYVAIVSLNGNLPGFAQQYTTCSSGGFDIRTFDAAGVAADRRFNLIIN